MKNIIRYCLTVISALCLAGCGGTMRQEERWNGKEVYLTAETVHSDRELLKPSSIVIFKDRLALDSHKQDKLFSLFELNGDSIRYIKDFLNNGRGPHEVIAADGHYMPEEDLFCVASYNMRGKNMFVPLDNPDNLFDVQSWTVYENNLILSSFDVIPINSSSMLVMREGEGNRMFAVMDLNESTIEDIDIFIPDDINAPLMNKLANIYIGKIRKRPNHNQFAYSSQEGHLVKVFELTDKTVGNSFDIFNELPKYHYENNKIRREKGNKGGFGLEVTEKYLYMGDKKLIDPMMPEDALRINGYINGYMKEMYVSDWEGNPVVKYMFDVPIVYYKIDKNDNYLYAFTYDPETLEDHLVRFKLPEL